MSRRFLHSAALLLFTLLAQAASGQISAGQAATDGEDGLANLTAGACASAASREPGASACDIVISPEYSVREFSRFFDPQKGGNADFYARMPTLGGMGRPRFAEDRRGANRYQVSLNALPVDASAIYNDRTPFVWEARTSNRTSYADRAGVTLIRQRISGGGHNYILPFTTQKSNFSALAINSSVRSATQGGGLIDMGLTHTAPGDDMVMTIQHDTNGCSEGEDECNKLFRSFLQTTTERWGGTLKAAPVPDPAGFGNYAVDVAIGPGYSAAQSGEDVFLVNLARPYTAGNVLAILQSKFKNFARITGDASTGWAKQFGASTITTLTARIDNRTYTPGCPATVTEANERIPDPMITDESGVGGYTGFCTTVESTAGFHDGEAVTIANEHSNLEMAKVVHVVDATHLTLNVQMYHDQGEFLSGGGAQGYGISMVADDIAPGGLVNYATQPKVILHKFFPILGSDTDGSLYVYTNAAMGQEISSVGYMANTPNTPATIDSVLMKGSAVSAVILANPSAADYTATPPGLLGSGQTTLAPPKVIFSGTCRSLPAATTSYNYPTNHTTGLVITLTSGGVCSSTPTAALQTEWPNPYRIAPLVVTKNVMNPATGSTTDGHLLVGDLRPSDWRPGDPVEIPGWIHDHAGSMQVFGKYYTGGSRVFGINDVTFFLGDWAARDTLKGMVNQTDGHKYYASAAQPAGPGVAYEHPPDGFALVGDYRIHLPLFTPPLEAVIDVGCTRGGFGAGSYHPCMDGIAAAYNLFQLHGNAYSYALRFDPTASARGLLAWSGPFAAAEITSRAVVHAAGGVQLGSQPSLACSAATRGHFNYIAGSPGTKDIVQVCAKDAADVFGWRTLY